MSKKITKYNVTLDAYITIQTMSNFHLVPGTYVDPVISLEALNTDLQQVFTRSNPPQCDVCARGALLCSYAIKHDSVNAWKTYSSYYSAEKPLQMLFGRKQLALIETSFEGMVRDYDGILDTSDSLIQDAKSFGEHLKNMPRFVAILENMLAHRGVFHPERKKSQWSQWSPTGRLAVKRARATVRHILAAQTKAAKQLAQARLDAGESEVLF